jgi:hypothetical protein
MTPLVAKMMMDPANNCHAQGARLLYEYVFPFWGLIRSITQMDVNCFDKIEIQRASDEHKHSYHTFTCLYYINTNDMFTSTYLPVPNCYLSVLDMAMPIRGRGEI